MMMDPVSCPYCGSERVVKRGKTDVGKQRYLCQNEDCSAKSFLSDYTYKGKNPDVKEDIIKMHLSGSGVRAIARALKVSTNTVINELRKKRASS